VPEQSASPLTTHVLTRMAEQTWVHRQSRPASSCGVQYEVLIRQLQRAVCVSVDSLIWCGHVQEEVKQR